MSSFSFFTANKLVYFETKISCSTIHRTGVDFTNILCAALLLPQIPKAQKIQSSRQSFLCFLGSVLVKAACKMLVKLTPDLKRQQIFLNKQPKTTFESYFV